MGCDLHLHCYPGYTFLSYGIGIMCDLSKCLDIRKLDNRNSADLWSARLVFKWPLALAVGILHKHSQLIIIFHFFIATVFIFSKWMSVENWTQGEIQSLPWRTKHQVHCSGNIFMLHQRLQGYSRKSRWAPLQSAAVLLHQEWGTMENSEMSNGKIRTYNKSERGFFKITILFLFCRF